MSRSVDIDEVLDNASVRAIHLRTLAVCTVAMMIDGYDLYLVGWILPSLSDSFQVSRVALTPVLLFQQAAMLLGAFFLAPVADRVGRRILVIACLIGIGLFSIGAALSSNATEFTVWRVLTGLCAAAVVPNLITLVSEIAPKRRRATFSTITVCGAMGGALIGAAMQAFILPRHGWSGALYLAAALSIVILPVLLLWLPESPRFLARRNNQDPRLTRFIAKVQPDLDPSVSMQVASGPQVAAEGRVRVLLGPGQRRTTVLLLCAFLASFLFIGQWSSWSTTVFKDVLVMDWKTVAKMTTLYTIMGVVGNLSVGFAIDRFGFRAVLPTTFLLGFIAAIGVGFTAPGSAMLFFLAMMGLFQHCSQAGLAALAPTLFPPSHKATGVGWAYGAGRAGGIIGPATGSMLAHLNSGPLPTFSGFGLPLLLASVVLMILLTKVERTPSVARVSA